MQSPTTFSCTFGGKTLTIDTAKFAQQTNASVTARYGDTVALATVVMGREPRDGIDYFPLTVDYDEKLYAAGRIKGSRWIKREGRPTDEAILAGRLMDHALRPLFDQRLFNEIHIVVTVLSFDEENDPDVVGLIAASTALTISDIPWKGPLGAIRLGKDADGKVVFNPIYTERDAHAIDIIFSGTAGFINMIETKANEVSEEAIRDLAREAQREIKAVIEFQEEIGRAVGKKKIEVPLISPDSAFERDLAAFLGTRLEEAIYQPHYDHMESANALKRELGDYVAQRFGGERVKEAFHFFEEEVNRIVHNNIIDHEKRPDGRGCKELRTIHSEVGVLPRTHGSGLFARGQTQALSVLTLGAPGAEQSLEGMEIVGTKRYIHHYNFPPFSTGEVGRLGSPKRREIGHGALAEKALEPLIPPKEVFPYTIRIVSEILSSNGSSSMASVCGSSLALMDGGVPISRPAAGIAIGLMMRDHEHYKILTDIQGPEDHHGDMDLKVAGTSEGVTAIQMDVKIEGITPEILYEALLQAKEARLQILEPMRQAIPEPRLELSPYAPRVVTLHINPDKIKDVIGPGGKMIHAIIEETGVDIDIEDSGQVFITSKNEEASRKAVEWVKNITREVVAGEVFQGKVVKIMAFGAFVEILPGQQGLVHVSALAPYHVERVEDYLKVGDVIPVKVKEIDTQGRINLILEQALEPRVPSPPRGPSHRYPRHGKSSAHRPRKQAY